MNSRTLISGLALVLACSAAVAADIPSGKREPVVPVIAGMNWTGFYGGVHAGWGASNFRASDQLAPLGGYWTPAATPGSSVFRLNGNGVIGGLQAGYQRQFGVFVVGIEVSGALADIKSGRKASPFFPAFDVQNSKVDALVTGTVKLGYAMDKFLPYIKLGYAGGNTKFSALTIVGAPASYSQTSWQHGWTAGAGVQYAWTRNLIVGVEYNYADLGSVTKRGRSTGVSGVFGPETYRTRVQVHKVALTLNYMFGGPDRPVIAKY